MALSSTVIFSMNQGHDHAVFFAHSLCKVVQIARMQLEDQVFPCQGCFQIIYSDIQKVHQPKGRVGVNEPMEY